MISDSERANYKSMSAQQLLERRENLDTILRHMTPHRRAEHRAVINEELLLRSVFGGVREEGSDAAPGSSSSDHLRRITPPNQETVA